MNTANKAYPLHWPVGWPRTVTPTRSRFGNRTPHVALNELSRQLELIKATGMFISSNVTLGATPKDKGVCVYFKLKGKDYALPCDKWDRVEDNIWALAQHIEALRGQERWGVATVERAFAGYMALPVGRDDSNWWEVIGCDHTAKIEEVRDIYRQKAKKLHPDNGGTAEEMALLNRAWNTAQKAFGQ